MMRNAVLVIGLLIGAVLAGVVLIDEGELATLRTSGPDGKRYETQLWVVDQGGELYLRAHYGGAKWLVRTRNQPEVELRREGESQEFLARSVDDPEVRRAVNRAMAAKYGFADRLASAVWDPEKSIPVHLDRNSAPARHP